MSEYRVNADIQINVLAVVEADSEEQAIKLAKAEILAKNCDFQDPINDPVINWVELKENEETDRQCYYCGQDVCDCDML